jgi:phosphatidate cytidylyltransferase
LTEEKYQNLKLRIVFGSLGIVGLLLSIFCASQPALQPLFVAAIAAMIGFALREFFQMAERLKTAPVLAASIFCSTSYCFAVYLGTVQGCWQWLPNFIVTVSFIALFVHFFFKGSNPLLNLSVTVFGLVWIGMGLSGLISIAFMFPDSGVLWLFYAMSIPKMANLGGYFVGKKFGKRKLAPEISPNKTLEGATGGIVFSVTGSLLFFAFSGDSMGTSLLEAALLPVFIAMVAELGDLAESLLKRDAGVKDSSALPGLGGILDIVDSLLFTTPVLLMYLRTR